jgi:hypothetical protein
VRGGGPPADGRSSITSTRGGGGSSIQSSGGGVSPIQRASDSGALVRASGDVPRPQGGGTSKTDEQAAPVDVQVATATHEARGSSEQRHGRREMRTEMIACDILRYFAVLGGPSDDLHLCLCHRRRPPATISFDSCFIFEYCVLCLPHVLFTLKTLRFHA